MKSTRFGIAASLMIAGFALQADTLNWWVSEQANQFTYAQVYATQNSDGTGGSKIEGAAALADGVTTEDGLGNTVSPLYSDIGNTYDTSWYFYVELVNYSDKTSWSMNQNSPWSYDRLLSDGYISTGNVMSTPVLRGPAADGGSGGSAPEPTSGLLLLIGGSLLALRRRRRQA